MKLIASLAQAMITFFTVIGLNSPLRPFVVNDAWMKILIITGCLKWWDVPHLHHPLILLKIQIDDMFERKRDRKTET